MRAQNVRTILRAEEINSELRNGYVEFNYFNHLKGEAYLNKF
jgi:hypothetical protein